MQYVSASDAEQCLAALLDTVQRGPVTIRSNHGDIAVIVSPQEYDRMRKFYVAELNKLCERATKEAQARGLTEEKSAEILANNED